MSIFTATSLRRLIPASGVAAVLALSFLAPVPSQASNLNNCGVKGYGYHDHGKVCPNRPFPGQGNGLTKFGITPTEPSGSNATTTGATTEITTSTDTSTSAGDTKASGKNHGHANGRGHNKGHGQD